MYKILIIEDDRKIRKELKTFLEKYNYKVEIYDDFSNFDAEKIKKDIHLILLDINLPQKDGFYICKEIRRKNSLPIIFITSRDNEMDELMGMHLGADDFITKPFNTQILLARIESIIRRTYETNKTNTYEIKNIKYYPDKSLVEYKEKTEELTKNENRILKTLAENRNKIVTRNQMMNCLWQTDEFVDDNTLTVNVNRLRNKLESLGVKDIIETKRGQGYIIK